MMGAVVSWYYCLVHQKVEPEEGCANAERMGPYATEQEAREAYLAAAATLHGEYTPEKGLAGAPTGTIKRFRAKSTSRIFKR